jgi:sugar-specific transcriptional regulator TrmB
MSMSSFEHLVRLGLNQNEAKALGALIALGPSGASDIHGYAEIPRNKAYEALERLVGRGIVEVQKGRPALYRSVDPKAVIDILTENYGNEAKEALHALEKKKDEMSEERGLEEGSASAWMIRGENGVRRRLAELIYGAKSDIFCVGGYPPKYLLTAKSALKAAVTRGITTRAVSMIRPTEDLPEVSSDDASVIEFRTVKASGTLRVRMQPHDEKIVGGFAGMTGVGAMVIIDEQLAFDIVDEGKDPKKATGIIFSVAGIPRIQKATAERILALYTRKL